MRALVVDDCDDDCHQFDRTFRRCSPRGVLERASTVDLATAKLSEDGDTRPDVVFVDLRMPGVPGVVLLEWIRSRPEFERLVVIAMTGQVDYANLVQPEQFGAKAVLLKPVAADDLARILGVASAMRQCQS